MNIEEKAKAYDNIIEKANKMHSENCEACQMCIEELIPELKESEDERIRKWLIYYFKEVCDNVSEKEKEGVLAWLEKQCDVNKEYWRGYREGKQEILDKYSEFEKQGEQKPAWSEEDEHWRQRAIDLVEHPDLIRTTPVLAKNVIDWLKSLKKK